MRSLFLAITLVFSQVVIAEESALPILSQNKMGKMACGPCAFVNSLAQSGDEASLALFKGSTLLEKAQDFAKRFGGKQSVVYRDHRTAYSDKNGTADQDLLAMINQLRVENGSPKLTGEYLLKHKEQSSGEFSQRVRLKIEKSIATGFPPLVSVKSVKAERGDDGKYKWNGIAGHWLCVLAIEQVDEDVSVLRLADSLSGKVVTALLFTSNPRNCVVPMTFEIDDKGKEKWDWVKGDRCLYVSSPSLPLGTQRAKWHERTYIAARYLITNQDVEPQR